MKEGRDNNTQLANENARLAAENARLERELTRLTAVEDEQRTACMLIKKLKDENEKLKVEVCSLGGVHAISDSD